MESKSPDKEIEKEYEKRLKEDMKKGTQNADRWLISRLKRED